MGEQDEAGLTRHLGALERGDGCPQPVATDLVRYRTDRTGACVPYRKITGKTY